jgi:hypothetical protein
VRELLAAIGVRHLDDIVGRSDLLQIKGNALYPKTSDIDLRRSSTGRMNW